MRAARYLGSGVGVVALVGAGFWAGRVTMMPPALTTASEAPRTVVAQKATVGKALNLSVTATQTFEPVGSNALAGVVTGVAVRGQVAEGGELYSVNAQRIRAVQGDIPFYRGLKTGDQGADVAQLERVLVRAGTMKTADDHFDKTTATALAAWRRSMGDPPAQELAPGTLVAFERLPAAVIVDSKVLRRGRTLEGGEEPISTAVGEPQFSLVVSETQASLLNEGALVEFKAGDKAFVAKLGMRQDDESGQSVFPLTGKDGASVCGADCPRFSTSAQTTFPGKVQVVPAVTGPAVPVAAIQTDPSGQAWLLVADHDAVVKTAVTVKGAQDGLAVVEGISEGATVILASPGEPPR